MQQGDDRPLHDVVTLVVPDLVRARVARAAAPAPEPRLAAGALEQPEDRGEKRPAEQHGEQGALQEIRPEDPRRGPVEAKALLDDERRPPAERQAHDHASESERPEVEEAGADGSEAEPAERAVEAAEAAGEPEGEQEGELDAGRDQPEACAGARVLLHAPIAIGVVDVAELRRHLGIERAQVQDVRHHPERELEEEGGEDDGAVDVHRFSDSPRTAAAGVPTLVSHSWCTARVAPTCRRRRAAGASGKWVVLTSTSTT